MLLQSQSSKSTSSSIEDGEDVYTCQQPQPNRGCVYPVSQAVISQDILGVPEHNLKDAADYAPSTLKLPLSHIDTMKKAIRRCHSGLSKAGMLEALNKYLFNLEVFCVPGTVPFWWPPGLDHREYINLNTEGKCCNTLFLSYQLTLSRPNFCYCSPSAAP
jgi:hypothetical protein